MKKMPVRLIVIIAVAFALISVVAVVVIVNQPDPLDQFITQRTCSFVDWGEFQAFACADGFMGTFAPLAPTP
jgi:hypothetical protein